MRHYTSVSRSWPGAICGLGIFMLLGGTGCQTQVGGQTLPSPHYLTDDVQYYAPGPEFKLAREAAAQKAFASAQAAGAAGAVGPGPGVPQPPPAPQPPPGAGAGTRMPGSPPAPSMGPGSMFSNDGVYVTGSR